MLIKSYKDKVNIVHFIEITDEKTLGKMYCKI